MPMLPGPGYTSPAWQPGKVHFPWPVLPQATRVGIPTRARNRAGTESYNPTGCLPKSNLAVGWDDFIVRQVLSRYHAPNTVVTVPGYAAPPSPGLVSPLVHTVTARLSLAGRLHQDGDDHQNLKVVGIPGKFRPDPGLAIPGYGELGLRLKH
eukprot:984433-Rhodomonas_salina.3